MRKVLIFIAFLFVSISCKEEVNETLQIIIQNRTDRTFHISLYPNEDYLHWDLYRHSDVGGGYTETEFDLPPNNEGYYDWDEVLFVSKHLNVEPNVLTQKVFDSIVVSTVNKVEIIRFTHENVIGYTENIFSEDSFWNFEIIEDILPDNFNQNPQKYHCYRFLILEDNIETSNLTQ